MLQFCDSMAHYTDITQKWDGLISSGGFPVVNRTFGRIGNCSLQFKASGGTTDWTSKTIPNTSHGFVGFAFRIPAFDDPSNNGYFLSLLGTCNVKLGVNNSMQLVLFVNTGVVATSSTSLHANTWEYIEVEFEFTGSAGSGNCIVTVKVEGVTLISATTTSVSGGGFQPFYSGIKIGSVDFGFPSGLYMYICDLYMCDNTGSVNNTYLGDVSVLAKYPTANGSTNQYTNHWASWAGTTAYAVGQQIKDSNNNIQRVTVAGTSGGSTPTWATTGGVTTTDGSVTWIVVGSGSNPGAANWMAVSEPFADDDNSYVADATVGHIDLYTFQSTTASSILAAVVNLRAEKDDSASRAIRAECKSSSTSADSGTDIPMTMGYAGYQGLFEVDPNTSSAWTTSNLNSAQFGIKTTV